MLGPVPTYPCTRGLTRKPDGRNSVENRSTLGAQWRRIPPYTRSIFHTGGRWCVALGLGRIGFELRGDGEPTTGSGSRDCSNTTYPVPRGKIGIFNLDKNGLSIERDSE